MAIHSISLYILSQAHQCTQRPICKQLAAVFQRECILGVWGMSWGVRSVRRHFSMSHLLRIPLRFPLSLTKGKRLLFNAHVASQSRQLSRCHSYPPSRSAHLPEEAQTETALRFTLIPNSAVTRLTVGFKLAHLYKEVCYLSWQLAANQLI